MTQDLAEFSLSLEKAMAPHSSTLAWKIPRTEEPGGLQSTGSLGVGHDWVTSLSLSCTGEGNGNPLQCSCLENPRDRGAWWAAVWGVAQSRTRLKRLSSSSTDAALSLLAELLTVSSDVLFQVDVDLRQIHSCSGSNHQEHSLYPALKRETTHTVH